MHSYFVNLDNVRMLQTATASASVRNRSSSFGSANSPPRIIFKATSRFNRVLLRLVNHAHAAPS